MKIQKIKETFNDYKVELSYGQLMAIHAALQNDHADPLSDELFAELGWYLENIPGPGQSEEEYDAAAEAEQQAVAGGQEGRDLSQLGQEIDAGPEGEMEPEGAEPPVEELDAGGEPEGDLEPGGGPEESAEADRYLAAPPAA